MPNKFDSIYILYTYNFRTLFLFLEFFYINSIMRTSYLISIFIALLAMAWVASAILYPSNEVGAENSLKGVQKNQVQKEMEVRVKRSLAQTVTDETIVTGRTQANRTVDVAAEITARVTEILLEEGSIVQGGQILAKLSLEDRAARVQEAKYILNQRQIEYNAAKSLEKQGFNSQIRLAEALAQLETARANLKLAERHFENTDVLAPFDGTINHQMIEVGDYVGEGTALFTIVDLDPLELIGYIAEANIMSVQDGALVKARFLNGDQVSGKIKFLAPAADPSTRTFRVVATIDNPDFYLRDGLTAEMIIPLTNVKAHRVPSSNLTLNDEGKIGIKIIDDQDRVQFFAVKVIKSLDGYVYVSGLPDTISYISVGAEFVAEGTVVSPIYEEGDVAK